MKDDFIEALVNGLNLVIYYSDSVSASFIFKNGQVVCSFDGNPDAESYIQELGNEMIELFIGNEELAGRLCDLQFLPFSLNGAERIYDKDREVTEFRVDITPGVERNCKLLFAMAFMDYIGNEMTGRFEKNPKATKDQIEAIRAFVQSITVGRMGEPTNDLYSIGLDGVKSANPLMNKALKGIYVQILETQLENYGVDSSEFFELNDNVLSIKDITNVRIVNNIAEHTAERIARHFARQGNKNSKVTNITDVFRREVFQLTKVNGKNGIVIDGYDCDAFTDKNAGDAGNDFALILKIAVSDTEVRDIKKEEADRINEAFKGFGGILIDIRGQTENTQFTNSQEPVYGIPNKQFALLIPELMKSPIGYNETSKCFEYAINPCKSRNHSDLSEDLDLILTRKFIPKDGKVRDYIWNCLSKSGFGLDGYDESELIEFVDKKIEEQKIVEKQLEGDLDRILMPKFTDGDGYVDFKGIKKVSNLILNSGFGCSGYSESDLEAEIGKYLQPIVRPSFLAVPTTNAMSDSAHSDYSADSGRGTDSQSGSPERKRPKDSTDSTISGSNLSLATSEAKLLLDQYQQHGSSSGKIASPLQQFKPISRDYGDNVASSGIKPLLDQCQHGSSSGKIASPLQQLKPISRDYGDNLPTSKTEPSLNQYSSFGKTCSPRLGAEVMYNEVIFPHVDHKIKEIEVGVAPENKLSYYGESDFSSQQSHLSNGDPVFSSQQKSHGSLGRKTSKTIKTIMATVNEVSVKQKLNSSSESHRDKELRKREEKQKKSEKCVLL